MIIETRRFSLQFPRRADLSGLPYGVLLILKSQQAPAGRWQRFKAREIGFFIPALTLRRKRVEHLECFQLTEHEVISADWRTWPEQYRLSAESAVNKALAQRPGTKLAYDRSYVDRRIDIAGHPIQMARQIGLVPA